ncbi:MAG: hypothetical protein HQK53_00900 [Oligoflexia bacterium]|nr:hypothetical protein [Oligoflexia bacterium]
MAAASRHKAKVKAVNSLAPTKKLNKDYNPFINILIIIKVNASYNSTNEMINNKSNSWRLPIMKFLFLADAAYERLEYKHHYHR